MSSPSPSPSSPSNNSNSSNNNTSTSTSTSNTNKPNPLTATKDTNKVTSSSLSSLFTNLFTRLSSSKKRHQPGQKPRQVQHHIPTTPIHANINHILKHHPARAITIGRIGSSFFIFNVLFVLRSQFDYLKQQESHDREGRIDDLAATGHAHGHGQDTGTGVRTDEFAFHDNDTGAFMPFKLTTDNSTEDRDTNMSNDDALTRSERLKRLTRSVTKQLMSNNLV